MGKDRIDADEAGVILVADTDSDQVSLEVLEESSAAGVYLDERQLEQLITSLVAHHPSWVGADNGAETNLAMAALHLQQLVDECYEHSHRLEELFRAASTGFEKDGLTRFVAASQSIRRLSVTARALVWGAVEVFQTKGESGE